MTEQPVIRSEEHLELRRMGFNEDQADMLLLLCVPRDKIIALVEVRKCPPDLAYDILR